MMVPSRIMNAMLMVFFSLLVLQAAYSLRPSQDFRHGSSLGRHGVRSLLSAGDDKLIEVETPAVASSLPRSLTGASSATSESPVNLNALLLVPVVWGSYSPVVKSVYNNADLITPPVLIFNLSSYLVSLCSLLLASSIASAIQSRGGNNDVDREENDAADTNSGVTGGSEARIGAELGMYLFIGSTLQVAGIQQVSAMKAAVLVQCTTIVVPLLDSLLMSTKLSANIWSACLIALLGVLLISIDDPVGLLSNFLSDGSFDPSSAFEKADLYILGATLFYSLHVVRLSRFASETKPLRLARYKSGTEFAACAATVAATLIAAGSSSGGLLDSFGTEIKQYVSSMGALPSLASQTPLVLGVLWNGALATALTTYLQTVGQRSVTATTANVIYSSQPIWASLFSFFFLGERITSTNAIGASLLCVAVLLAASAAPGDTLTESESASEGE